MMSYNLNIVSIEHQIFCGEVKRIQITGVEGEMGIVSNHSPLLTFIKPGILRIITLCNNEEYIYVSGGILEARKNVVIILADTACRSEEFDEKKAIESQRNAEENIFSTLVNNLDYVRMSLEISKIFSKLRLIQSSKHNRYM